MEWYTNDPRESIGKRDKIVIVDLALNLFSIADVETKNAYCIWTSFIEKPFINADNEWPASWLWTFYPNRDEAIIRPYLG